MPVSPICLVQDGAGPFNPTLNGVDVGPGDTISIELDDPTGVVDWFLEITGTDELSTAPALTGVDVFHHVTSPVTIVTFTYPNADGRALLFTSTVTGPGGPLTTTFAIFTVTAALGYRVGASSEKREGSLIFGWVTKTNPLIRSASSVSRNVTIITASGVLSNARDALAVVSTSLGAFTVNLPLSPTVGRLFDIKDGDGNALVNPITIGGNGHNIDGAVTQTIDINFASVSLIYNGTQWNIV